MARSEPAWGTLALHDSLVTLRSVGKRVAGAEQLDRPDLVLLLGGLVVMVGSTLEELDPDVGEQVWADFVCLFLAPRTVSSPRCRPEWTAAQAWLMGLLDEVAHSYEGRDEAGLMRAIDGVSLWAGCAAGLMEVAGLDLAVAIGEAEERLCEGFMSLVAESVDAAG